MGLPGQDHGVDVLRQRARRGVDREPLDRLAERLAHPELIAVGLDRQLGRGIAGGLKRRAGHHGRRAGGRVEVEAVDLVAVRLGDVHVLAVRRDRGAEAVDLPGEVERRARDRVQAAVRGDRQGGDRGVGVARRRPERPAASGHVDEAAVRRDHDRTRVVDPDRHGRGWHERQRAVVGDREDGDRGCRLGRIAIRRQQELAIRGEAEAGRLVSAVRRRAQIGQRAVGIDLVAPDRVVAGVGDVDVPGVGADRDAVGILAGGDRRTRQCRQRAVLAAVEGREAPVTADRAVAHIDAAVGARACRQREQQKSEKEDEPEGTRHDVGHANPDRHYAQAAAMNGPSGRSSEAQGELGVLGHHLDG